MKTALALIAFSLALEAGFLLQVAAPARTAAAAPAAGQVARAAGARAVRG